MDSLVTAGAVVIKGQLCFAMGQYIHDCEHILN